MTRRSGSTVPPGLDLFMKIRVGGVSHATRMSAFWWARIAQLQLVSRVFLERSSNARLLCLCLAVSAFLTAGGQVQAQTVESYLFTNLNRPVPDGNAAGLSDMRSVASSIVDVSAVRVTLNIAGEFNGDLYGYLRRIRGGVTNFCVLINRPGRASTNLAGYGDSGLNIALDDSIAVTDIHTYRSVTNLPAGAPLLGAWRTDGRAIDPGAVLTTSPRTTSLTSFTNAEGSGEWTLFLADMESGGTNMLVSWELQLSGKARPAINWPTPAAIAYGSALGVAQLNATSPVPGSFTYNPPTGAVLKPGNGQSLSVTFTPTDTNSYSAVTTNVSINVLKAALTIAAVSTNKIYGAAVPGFSASYAGFVNGDTVAVLTSPTVWTTTATAGSPAGLYPITASGAAGSNYTIVFVGGTLTIARASTIGLVSSSKNPSLPGDGVTFTFALSAVAPGAGTPTGLVQFKIDGANAGAPAALAGGVAGHTSPSLSAGTHTVVAEFAGDGNFFGTTNTLSPNQSVNTPPLAGVDTIERGWTNGTKVLVTTLLGNDTDADGDAISFVSFDVASTNGAVITRAGDWIHYAPGARLTLADSFGYTISDSRGATTRGTVVVVVRNDELPSQNLAITDRGDGSYLIRFDGIPRITYRIERNENLDNPLWVQLGSATADASGVFQFIDTPPIGSPRRYYRSVYP